MYNKLEIQPTQLTSLAQELMSKVETDDETHCWWWTGITDRNGYGRIRVPIVASPGYEWVLTHRLTYIIRNGTLPKGTMLYRTCMNPMCCNPDHLFIEGGRNARGDFIIEK